MSLKAQMRAALAGEDVDVGGFDFHKPNPIHFRNADGFHKAVKEQSESVAMIEADALRRIDIGGKVEGTSLRLSHAAFGDLCHWSNMPVGFIKKLGKIEEALALDVIETMLMRVFQRGETEKSLVIDSRNGVIEGIVGTESYSPISNLQALEYALSASAELKLSNGWLSGPNMRMTAVSEKQPEVRKGDIVRFGMSLENGIQGDRSLKVADYSERLVCTNGATACDEAHTRIIVHRGDVEYNTQHAVVESSNRSQQMLPLMRAAAGKLMLPPDIRSFAEFAQNPKMGGNESLWSKVRVEAKREAVDEGRTEEEITLWNFVNGITQSAHDTNSLGRRGELEAMGYRALVKFGVPLLTN